MICGDFVIRDGDKEESVGAFARDSDIGFISCGGVIDLAFTGEIEEMTIRGSGFGVVENGLIGDGDLEDLS